MFLKKEEKVTSSPVPERNTHMSNNNDSKLFMMFLSNYLNSENTIKECCKQMKVSYKKILKGWKSIGIYAPFTRTTECDSQLGGLLVFKCIGKDHLLHLVSDQLKHTNNDLDAKIIKEKQWCKSNGYPFHRNTFTKTDNYAFKLNNRLSVLKECRGIIKSASCCYVKNRSFMQTEAPASIVSERMKMKFEG